MRPYFEDLSCRLRLSPSFPASFPEHLHTQLELVCLFSGREGDLSSARTIYGRDVVRLPSVGWFAQTVGKIIQGRLQALES